VEWVEANGVAAAGGLRRDLSPADWPDAALLQVAWEGPWPAGHPLVGATVNRVLERLSVDGLLYRQPPEIDDGAAGPDSPDLLASVWGVRALAALGHWEEAHERMAAIIALAGPLGVLSAAGDPLSNELLGNFPDTAVHLAFVDAAIDLAAGPG
jgi:GH15 family glucan-1,4-alpha-glucosidase